MKTRLNLNICFILVFTSLVIITCCTFSSCDFGKIKSTATVGTLDVTIDENLEPLMLQEKKEYERINTEAKINLKTEPTRLAFADIINRNTKFIVVSREILPDEQKFIDENKIDLKKYAFAVDAVGFIVNNDNPISRLTSSDLKNIFTGDITKWTDIKSQNEDQNKNASSFFRAKDNIKVFIQRKNSATYDFVKDSVLGGKDYISSAEICSTSTQMLESIRKNPNSIGITNLSWMSVGEQEKLDSTIKTIRVSYIGRTGRQYDFTEFHQGLVYNQTYPYRRKIYAYSSEGGISLSTGFLTFLLGTDGQKIALKYGLVPVTQPVRTIQLN
ncbi:phosphate ABC transporter substrate-binding protein [soil metagenome]